jgi:hypothetical protein
VLISGARGPKQLWVLSHPEKGNQVLSLSTSLDHTSPRIFFALTADSIGCSGTAFDASREPDSLHVFVFTWFWRMKKNRV